MRDKYNRLNREKPVMRGRPRLNLSEQEWKERKKKQRIARKNAKRVAAKRMFIENIVLQVRMYPKKTTDEIVDIILENIAPFSFGIDEEN